MKSKNELLGQIVNAHKNVFGNNFELGANMTVSPVQVQRAEEKMRQTYKFLGLITSTPTEDSWGEIISLAESASIGQRTVTAVNGMLRRPVSIGAPNGRQFKVEKVELDVVILWNTILQWGMESNDVFNSYRYHILRSRAGSRLRIGFYGQSENAAISSNLSIYDMMQDVMKGWFQYMIENRPAAVFGITVGGVTAKGYDINPVKVGLGGDFASMAQLVDYLKNNFITRIHRGNTAIHAIVGTSLQTVDVSRLVATAGVTPTERYATEALMMLDTIATIPVIVPDEFPERGLMLTDPKNLEYIYQIQSVERSIENSQDKTGIVDYLWQKVDYVIRELDACAMVHPDAIQFKNEITGVWEAATDTWAISPVV